MSLIRFRRINVQQDCKKVKTFDKMKKFSEHFLSAYSLQKDLTLTYNLTVELIHLLN